MKKGVGLPPDGRGWIGIGVFFLVIMILWMIAAFPELRKDDFFQSIAILIVGTGFINGVVAWAYSATKQGGELADRAANIVEHHASSPEAQQPVETPSPPSAPAPTADAEELPSYAR